MDFKHTVNEVHSSLDDSEVAKNISNDTIYKLVEVIDGLREVKRQRMQKVRFEICSCFSLLTCILVKSKSVDCTLNNDKKRQNQSSNPFEKLFPC